MRRVTQLQKNPLDVSDDTAKTIIWQFISPVDSKNHMMHQMMQLWLCQRKIHRMRRVTQLQKE
jgi:hypothetical protein